MKRALEAAAAAALLLAAPAAHATPSTVFWTPATTYVQPYLVPHVTYDTYVAEMGALQNDYGLTIGLLPGEKVQAEAGLDLFLPTRPHGLGDYLQLNAKVGLAEGALAPWAPGLSAGISNAGFKKDVSDYHLLHLEAGKSLPFGAVAVGGYYGAGSKLLWTGSDGDVHRAGVMASYTSPDLPVNLPGLQKVNVLVDGASGKNWMGAVGGGLALYFTPAIDLITGPVFFLDRDLYQGGYGSDFMWTVQVDVDVDLIRKPAKG